MQEIFLSHSGVKLIMTQVESGLQSDINESILAYLKKMGYRQSERIFTQETKEIASNSVVFEKFVEEQCDISNFFILNELSQLSEKDINQDADYTYSRFCKWILDSLDIFKDELTQFLFPVFAHIYLDLVLKDKIIESKSFFSKFQNILSNETADLDKLSIITDSKQIKDNIYANSLRNSKVNVFLSPFTFHLLMDYLLESNLILVLKILNHYINICVVFDKSKTNAVNDLSLGKNQFQSKTLELSVKNIHPQYEEEVRNRLKNDLIVSGLCKSYEHAQNQTLNIFKLLPKESDIKEPVGLPRPEPISLEIRQEVERVKQLSGRLRLSSTVIPSIFCYTLFNSNELISSIDVSPDSTLLSTGTCDSYIDIWSLKGEKLRSLKQSTELAAMDLDDLSTLDPLLEPDGSISKQLVGHSGPVYSSKFFLANNFLVSGSQDSTLRLWSLKTFSNLSVYKTHLGPVWDVDVSSLGFYFASGSADRTAALWSSEYTKCVRLFSGHYSDVESVKFHPNSTMIASGSSDRTCRIWDIKSGNCVRVFGKIPNSIGALSFSPNGKLVSCGDNSGNIKVWDISSGNLLLSYTPQKPSQVSSLDICKDSRVLCSTNLDGFVSIWDLQSVSGSQDNPVQTFPTKSTVLYQARFTPRNSIVVAGCYQQ
jgi:transcription initiation factor TFIID subunit 5